MRLNTVLTEAQILDRQYATKREDIISNFMESYVEMKSLPLSEAGYQLTEKKIRDEFIQEIVLLPIDQIEKLQEGVKEFISKVGTGLSNVKKSLATHFPTFAKLGKAAMDLILKAVSDVIGKIKEGAQKFFGTFQAKTAKTCPGMANIKPVTTTKEGVSDVHLMYGEQILVEYQLEDTIGKPALAEIVKGERFAKALDVPTKLAEAIVAVKIALSKDDKTKNEFVRGLNVREIMMELDVIKAFPRPVLTKLISMTGFPVGKVVDSAFISDFTKSPQFSEWVNKDVRHLVKSISTELGLKDDGMLDNSGCGGLLTIEDMNNAMGSPEMTEMISKFNLPLTDVSTPMMKALKNQQMPLYIGAATILVKFCFAGSIGLPFIMMIAGATVLPIIFNLAAEKGKASIPPMKESSVRTLEWLAKGSRLLTLGINLTAMADALVSGTTDGAESIVDAPDAEVDSGVSDNYIDNEIKDDDALAAIKTPDVIDPKAPADHVELKKLETEINAWENSAKKEVFSDKTVTAFFKANPDMNTEQMEKLRAIFDDAHKTNASYEKMNQIFSNADKGMDLIDKDVTSFQAAADTNLATEKTEALAKAKTIADKAATQALLDAQASTPTVIDGLVTTPDEVILTADLKPVITLEQIATSKEAIFDSIETPAGTELKELINSANSDDAASVVDKLAKQAFTPEEAKSFLESLESSDDFFGDSTYKKLTEGDGKLFDSVAEYAKVSEMNANDLKQVLSHVNNGGLEILQPALDANVDPAVIHEMYADVEVEVTDPETDEVSTEMSKNEIKGLFGDNPEEITKSMKFFAHVEPEQVAKILELSTDNPGVVADISGPPFVGNKGAEALAEMLNFDTVTSENIQALADSKALANTYSITSHVGTALDGKTDELLAKFAEIDSSKAEMITRDILTPEVNTTDTLKILEADVATLNNYTTPEAMIVELNNQSVTQEALDGMTMDRGTALNLENSIGEADLVTVKEQLEATKATMAGIIGHADIPSVDYDKVVNAIIEDAKAVNGTLTFDTTAYQTAQDAFIAEITANGGNLPFEYMTDESIETTITDATAQAQERLTASANNAIAFNVVHASGTIPDYGSYQGILSTPLAEAQESLSASTRALEMYEGNGDATGVATATTEIAQSKMDIVVATETKKVLAAVIEAQDATYTGTDIEIAAQKSAGISSAFQTAMADIEGGEDVTAKVTAQMEQLQTNAMANATANPVLTPPETGGAQSGANYEEIQNSLRQDDPAVNVDGSATTEVVSTESYTTALTSNAELVTQMAEIADNQQDIIAVLVEKNIPVEQATTLLKTFSESTADSSLESFKSLMDTASTSNIPMEQLPSLLTSIGTNLDSITAGGSLDDVMKFASDNNSFGSDITRMMEFAGDGKLARLLAPMSDMEMPKDKIMAVLSGSPENLITVLGGETPDTETIKTALEGLNTKTVEEITTAVGGTPDTISTPL